MGMSERGKIRIEMDVIIKDEDIDDIMVSALEGGITYWCDKAEPVGECLGTYASEQISHGGLLRLHDAESDDDLILTKERFFIGFKRYLKAHSPVGFLELIGLELRVDPGCIDGGAADAIIQYALFGDVIYG